ncbi:MAG: nicotinate phosphoribosyltransferase [Bacilli bacterium]|jgi:nicotinate phosphoribosyltransferase
MFDEIKLKESGKISRLTNKTFQFPPSVGEGFFTANYFLKAQRIVRENCPGHRVTCQWFQRRDGAMVCGLDEVIALVHTFAHNPEDLEIYALNDGDLVNNEEAVLTITGRYEDFGFLESLIDGILSRRSSIATNVYEVIKVSNGKAIFSMADRQDDYLTQIGDGYATYVAGIKVVSTDAQGYWYNGRGGGTMPHALIQICNGDLIKACEMYLATYPDEKVCALIDYHNDCVKEAVRVAKHFGKRLGAVRLDTSKKLIDKYFDDKDTSGFDPHGVCKELVFAVRDALDQVGATHVKIVVSSGFNREKIAEFEKAGTPVDTYGVGTAFCKNDTCGFTGDLVVLDGKKQAKIGRDLYPNPRLKKVPFPIY